MGKQKKTNGEKACLGSTAAHCYVVVAQEDYEPDVIICVYTDKTKAREFCAICKRYQATHSPYPSSDDRQAWNVWEEKDKAWQEEHPAYDNGFFRGYEDFKIIDKMLHA